MPPGHGFRAAALRTRSTVRLNMNPYDEPRAQGRNRGFHLPCLREAGLVRVAASSSPRLRRGHRLVSAPAEDRPAAHGGRGSLRWAYGGPGELPQGLAFFAQEQFVEARAALSAPPPAARDAQTQSTSPTVHRQGWGRLYKADTLYRQGHRGGRSCHRGRAGGVSPSADPTSGHTGGRVRAELQEVSRAR